jgi:hypothetical protein
MGAMVLIFHVVTALASLVAAGAAMLSPSPRKLRLTYILTAGMLLSGSYLVMNNTSHLIEACVMGLAYLAIISVEIFAARHKLVQALMRSDDDVR